MPDKIDKYVIDNELIDKGWEQMQAILEREMPVEKKKPRILPIWFWSSGIAASLLLASLLVFKEDKSKVENQFVQNQTIQSTNEVAKDKVLMSEIATSTIQSHNKSLPIEKINTPIITKNKASKNTSADAQIEKEISDDIVKNNNLQNIENQNIDKEILTKVTTDKLFEVGANNSILSQTKTEAQDNAVRKTNSESLRSTLAFMPTLATPLANVNTVTTAFDFGIKKASVAAKLPRNFRHGIFGRINYMGFIDNSFSFGYLNQYRINNRHHLQTKLFVERNSRFVHTITESYTLSKALLDTKAAQNIPNLQGDTTITQVVYPFYENCACAAIARLNNVPSVLSKNDDVYILANSWQLGLSANYAYRFAPRWEVSSGFGISYAVKALEYSFAVNYNNSNFKELENHTTNLPSLDNSNVATLNSADNTYINFAKNQEVFNRLDGYWEIGMNFYVNKRLSLGGGYRRGLIDITKNDALNIKDFNRAITMQSIFFF